jgi:hypothetical protein
MGFVRLLLPKTQLLRRHSFSRPISTRLTDCFGGVLYVQLFWTVKAKIALKKVLAFCTMFTSL